MCFCRVLIVIFVLAGSVYAQKEFEYRIDTKIVAEPARIPDGQQKYLDVGVIIDPHGDRAQFVEGEVVLQSDKPGYVKQFADSWKGKILADDTLPQANPKLVPKIRDIPLTKGFFRVGVNVDRMSTKEIPGLAKQAGLHGKYTFSSEAVLKLFGLYLKEAVNGNKFITLNTVFRAHQCTITSTHEHPLVASAPDPSLWNEGFNDAYSFGWTSDADMQLIEAWDLIDLLGATVERRTLCVLDRSFDINQDFEGCIEYDFINGDHNADSGGDYHGLGSLSMACAQADNEFGSVGTGHKVVQPMAFHHNYTMWQSARAIRTAIHWGADIVSMSFGVPCDWWCSLLFGLAGDAPLTLAIDEAYDHGLVLLASAGNDELNLNLHHILPVEAATSTGKTPIGVGAITLDTKMAVRSDRFDWGSNYGNNVDIWAPGAGGVEALFLWVSPNPGSDELRAFGGTSCAAPYTAGIVAMMQAVNPRLDKDQIESLLQSTANSSPDIRVETGYVNAFAAVRAALQEPGGIVAEADELEPNDADTWSASDPGSFCLNLSRDDPYDRFYFRVDDFCRVLFGFDAHPEFDDMVFRVSGGVPRVDYAWPYDDVIPPGIVYVEATANADDHVFYEFDFELLEPVTIPPDRFEMNNRISQAADLIFPADSIGKTLIVDSLNFHNDTDADYYLLSIPDMPSGPTLYTDRLTLLAEPTEQGVEESFILEIYKPDGTESGVYYNGVTLEDLHQEFSGGEIVIAVHRGGRHRNHYRLQTGYDQWPRGIAPPTDMEIIIIPEWLSAMRDMDIIHLPESFTQGLPLDLPFPSDPETAHELVMGQINTAPEEMILFQWPTVFDFTMEFAFQGPADAFHFHLVGEKGEPIATAQVPKSVQETGILGGLTKPKKILKMKKLPAGLYGIRVVNKSQTLETITAALANKITRVEIIDKKIPETIALQNYPNPFNPSTKIQYEIPRSARVNLTVYNTRGQQVDQLVDQMQTAGIYAVEWDGTGHSAGIYFYVLDVNSPHDDHVRKTAKMLLIN
jgi:hypothetical protein